MWPSRRTNLYQASSAQCIAQCITRKTVDGREPRFIVDLVGVEATGGGGQRQWTRVPAVTTSFGGAWDLDGKGIMNHTKASISELKSIHQELDGKLSALTRHARLNPEEQLLVKEIKKRKLSTKDRIARLSRTSQTAKA